MIGLPQWFYWALGVCVFGAGVMTGDAWRKERDEARDNAAKVVAQKAADAERARVDSATNAISTKAALRQAEIQQQNQAVYIEVPKYVTKIVHDPECVHAMRVLNDAAASGVPVSDAAAATDDAADDAQDVAATVAENIGQCRADLERFAGLQEWVRGVSAP